MPECVSQGTKVHPLSQVLLSVRPPVCSLAMSRLGERGAVSDQSRIQARQLRRLPAAVLQPGPDLRADARLP